MHSQAIDLDFTACIWFCGLELLFFGFSVDFHDDDGRYWIGIITAILPFDSSLQTTVSNIVSVSMNSVVSMEPLGL